MQMQLPTDHFPHSKYKLLHTYTHIWTVKHLTAFYAKQYSTNVQLLFKWQYQLLLEGRIYYNALKRLLGHIFEFTLYRITIQKWLTYI